MCGIHLIRPTKPAEIQHPLTFVNASLYFDPHADGPRVRTVRHNPDLRRHDRWIESVLHHGVRVPVALHFPVARPVDVAHVALHAGPPVVHFECLGELLSVAVPEATLGEHGRNDMRHEEVDLEVLGRVRTDELARTPGTAGSVHVEAGVGRADGRWFVAGRGRQLGVGDAAVFKAKAVGARGWKRMALLAMKLIGEMSFWNGNEGKRPAQGFLFSTIAINHVPSYSLNI